MQKEKIQNHFRKLTVVKFTFNLIDWVTSDLFILTNIVIL